MNGAAISLLPRARLADVVRGRAAWVGSRTDPTAARGLFSPIEPRLSLGTLYDDPVEAERKALDERRSGFDFALVARIAIARALGGAPSRRRHARPWIVSSHVDNVTIPRALDLIFEAPTTPGQGRFVAFAHPHALNLARFDGVLRGHLADADVVLPDGVGLRVASRVLGTPLVANVNGTDLLPLLCKEAASRGVRLAFIGAKEGVARRAAENLTRAEPGLDVAFVTHGYLDAEATRDALASVRALGRVVVLVGMGSPVQERWCHAARAACPEATFVTVGGLFDFFSGDMPRAPLAIRELGLEWAFRLAQEPRRMAKRYLLGNPLFLGLSMWDRISRRPSRTTEARP